MTHDGELCAALPMTQIGITAWYCHVHQGWCWSSHVYLQGSADEVHVVHSHDGDLGPFDGPDDLTARWHAILAEGLAHIERQAL